MIDDAPLDERDNVVLATMLESVFGTDAFDDSAYRTAERVLAYWEEYNGSAAEPEVTTFPSTVNQLIIAKDIEFSSICAHHLLPFLGVCHIGYVPNALMIGLSKMPRIVDYFAKRPQVQERLTEQIASYMKHKLEAMGVAVVIEAQHTCMACRGVRKHNGRMVTSEMRGIFLTAGEARSEFLRLIGH